MKTIIVALVALTLTAVPGALASEANAQATNGPCGGAVVYDCSHTHGSTTFTCDVYTEGTSGGSKHFERGPREIQIESDCIHE